MVVCHHTFFNGFEYYRDLFYGFAIYIRVSIKTSLFSKKSYTVETLYFGLDRLFYMHVYGLPQVAEVGMAALPPYVAKFSRFVLCPSSAACA